MTWHLDTPTLACYLDRRLAEAAASSVEAHLLSCGDCRDQLRQLANSAQRSVHDRTWEALADYVDMPSTGVTARLLGRFLPNHLVRLLSATSTMGAAWWTSGTAVLVLALLMAHLGRGTVGTALFVVTAPLVPLAGVAVAYSRRTDVAGEVVATTPFPRFRLLLLRTAAVVAATLPLVGMLAVALPVDAHLAALWVSPALALCALSLALSSVIDARKAAAVLAFLWIVAAWSALRPVRAPLAIDVLLERAVVFRPVGQAVLLGVALAASLVAFIRRHRLEEGLT
jgi:hypothetical protein